MNLMKKISLVLAVFLSFNFISLAEPKWEITYKINTKKGELTYENPEEGYAINVVKSNGSVIVILARKPYSKYEDYNLLNTLLNYQTDNKKTGMFNLKYVDRSGLLFTDYTSFHSLKTNKAVDLFIKSNMLYLGETTSNGTRIYPINCKGFTKLYRQLKY